MKLLSNRFSEFSGALVLIIFGMLCFWQGDIAIGITFILVDVILVSGMIWYDTIGKKMLTAKRDAEDLERVKEEFALKEGELVEVLCTPSEEESLIMRISLKVQKKVKTRYFALLEGETISIVPMVGEEMLEPEKINFPRTLERQFTPITEVTEEE